MTPEEATRRNVSRLRHERGMSQTDLARKLGWPKQTMSDVESGKRRIRLDEALALAHVLEAAPVHLITPWDEDDEYEVLSDNLGATMDAHEARYWVMGFRIPPVIGHPRRFFSAVPDWWWDTAARIYESFKAIVGDRWSWTDEGPYDMTYGRDLAEDEVDQVREWMAAQRKDSDR